MTTEESFRLPGISHIMLGVADLQNSLALYHDKLGMEVKQQFPGFAFLDGGGVQLALSEPLGKASAAVAGDVEFVFAVDDIDSSYAHLTQRGVLFPQPPRQVTEERWAANFTDPDGHHLSIFGPRVT